MLLRVGLTGGIATGKSTVLSALKEHGCLGIDADLIVHDLMCPGSPILSPLVQQFGPDITREDGGIDRKRLARTAFSDPTLLEKLEAIVHPEVVRIINRRAREIASRLVQNDDASILVVDVALLLEKRPELHLHRIVVTSCSEEEQLRRLTLRGKMPYEEARKRIRAQMPSGEKLGMADFTIDTSGGMDSTLAQCRSLYERLREDLQALLQGADIRPKAYMDDRQS